MESRQAHDRLTLLQEKTLIDLTICSRALAGKILNNPRNKIDFLISIGDPDRDPPSGFYKINLDNRLKLVFFDYITRPDDYEWVLAQPYHPTKADIDTVINFVHTKIKSVENPSVLVHCEVGISRSPAIAQIVLQELGLSEKDAIAKVMEVRSQSVPNQFILSLYKESKT